MTATLISRISKAIKFEVTRAAARIELDGYTTTDSHVIDSEGGRYPILFYRAGEEVIAVADFYIGEEGVSLTGSKGGHYILNGETVVAE